MKVRTIIFDRFGEPSEVCRCAPVEVPGVGDHEVRVRMSFAPINPADINMIQGVYATRPNLPATPGGEGIGIVEAIGDRVTELEIGHHVLIPAALGSWREVLIAAADELIPVPADLPMEQAAMLRVNPATAYRMLHDFANLEPGDWIVQNAANSGVGRSVIQIARARGWRTVSVVRRPELIEELREAGADVVLQDSAELSEQVVGATSGELVRLALNAVGGESAMRLAQCLTHGGTHVTYGAMSRQPVRIPNSLLIFHDLRFQGFWVTQWYRTASIATRDAMFADLIELLKERRLFTPVDRMYSLDEITDALRRAMEGGRTGKVLLRM